MRNYLRNSPLTAFLYDLKHTFDPKVQTIPKKEFIDDLKLAIEDSKGYAAGKLGGSQQRWMYYEIFLQKNENLEEIQKYEEDLIFHGFQQTGIFPPKPSFYLEYNKFYMNHVKNLDCSGIFSYDWEPELVKYYRLEGKLIPFQCQEPDRSSPSNEDNCYLQYFNNKKLLLICPFAELLRQRATREIFENVWSKTGKKWFYPAQVDSLEFPYGFERATQEKYATAIDLFESIKTEIDQRDFDIALISASGLAIPIASYIKNIGKIGIDLGGHQQVLFGVIGKRWKESRSENWQEKYFNEHWIEMPEKYKPTRADVCDKGAYW
jgi:hypothetical protein